MEIWKAIEGTNGKYEVSNTGKVRSKGTHVTRGTRELKPKTDRYGYTRVTIFFNGKKKTRTIHRLVAETFIQNKENLPQVNHIDGNKKNNNVENLEWCTASQNIKHAFDTGLKEKSRERASIIGKRSNERKSKKIVVTDKYGVSVEYKSISDASRSLGLERSNIQQALRPDTNRRSVGGYTFKLK